MAGMNLAQAIAQNINARRALLQNSPPMTKDLGVTAGQALGQTARIKLYNVGIITSLLIKVTATITIGTAIATPSPQAPFNLINRIRLTDFDGVDRVSCTGHELFALNCMRDREYYGYQNEAGAASVLTNPSVPTAVGAGATLSFFLRVPLAYDARNDLRGSLLAQVTNGEAYLNIDWATQAGLYTNANADAVYNGAGTTTVALTALQVQVWQDYLIPQAISGPVELPAFDLLTVYEINGSLKSSDNLAANSEKLINMPNVRQVIGAYLMYVNNGIMNPGSDVSRLRVIANGNNTIYEATADAHLFRLREWLGGDLRNGFYPFNFRQKPIETNLYGNVQIGFSPSTVNAGNTYVGVMTESFFTKGATLPGAIQSS